jgi:hypothetical protein
MIFYVKILLELPNSQNLLNLLNWLDCNSGKFIKLLHLKIRHYKIKKSKHYHLLYHH